MTLKKVTFWKRNDAANIEDMLRYDLGFVSDEEPNIVAFPVFHSRYGNYGGYVTHARWASFGVTLKPASDDNPLINVPGGILERADKWHTYRHKAGTNMELVPVTLAKYLKVKDIYELDKEEM